MSHKITCTKPLRGIYSVLPYFLQLTWQHNWAVKPERVVACARRSRRAAELGTRTGGGRTASVLRSDRREPDGVATRGRARPDRSLWIAGPSRRRAATPPRGRKAHD